jgi:hypothetical protein
MWRGLAVGAKEVGGARGTSRSVGSVAADAPFSS